jgi:hypothetical protein
MPTGRRRGEQCAVELRQELDDPGVADLQPAALRLTVQLADERVDVDSRACRETLLESHAVATENVSEQPRAYAFGRPPSTEKCLPGQSPSSIPL